MGKKKEKKKGEYTVSMDMTPMIDVVFQLLIFFLVTLKPQDVIGRLDVFRPQAESTPPATPPEMLRVSIHKNHRYMLDQRWMTMNALEQNLTAAAKRSRTQTVIIQCAEASEHGGLMAVLDICAKVGLSNLSVVTLPPSPGA